MFNHKNFLILKTEAETFYRSTVKIKCPALKADVHFTSDGFHHLRYDNTRAERSKSEQINKLMYLPEAVNIVNTTTTVQEYRAALQAVGKPANDGFRKMVRAEYYAFSAIINIQRGIRIRVVIRRLGDGLFHFWSLMPSWRLIDKDNPTFGHIIGSKEIEDG
jgi:hypothetical protein